MKTSVQTGWRGQKVLVTGATGFLGYHVALVLARSGASVRALVRKSADRRRLLAAGVTCTEGSLENVASLIAACQGCEWVFHLAGAVDFGSDWEVCRGVNVEGTGRLIGAARSAGVRRVVHTSSVVTVGAARAPTVLDERATWDLERLDIPYVTTKRQAEDLALDAASRNLEVIVVNPGCAVGPDDFSGSEYGTLCRRFWLGRIPFYFGGGNCFVDVRDVATGHLLAAQSGASGQRYILGGRNMAYGEFFRLLSQVAARRIFRLRMPLLFGPLVGRINEQLSRGPGKRPYLTRPQARLLGLYFYFDSARAERELGFRARPIESTLADAYEFWLGAGKKERVKPTIP